MKLDRRRNKAFITRNTEYHVHHRECVGVRDRKTGRWIHDHPALRSWLLGGMDRRKKMFHTLLPGTRLVFTNGERDVLTSPLLEVERPEKPSLECYTWRAKMGVIEAAA